MLTEQTTVAWQDSRDGVALLERMSQPSTLRALSNILDRAEALDKLSEKLVSSSEESPQLLSIGVDTADELFQEAAERGIDWDDRIKQMIPLIERLTEPGQLRRLEGLLDFADQIPGLVSMAVDTFDNEMEASVEGGFDLASLGELGSKAGSAILEAAREPADVKGLFSLFRQMNDPDRRKALGFLMTFLKHLGKRL